MKRRCTRALWIEFFIDVVLEAQAKAEKKMGQVLQIANFLKKHGVDLNDWQRLIIRKMAEGLSERFIGGMSAKKYMSITGTSKATATRDLQQLLAIQAFSQIGSGRNVRYELNLI